MQYLFCTFFHLCIEKTLNFNKIIINFQQSCVIFVYFLWAVFLLLLQIFDFLPADTFHKMKRNDNGQRFGNQKCYPNNSRIRKST